MDLVKAVAFAIGFSRYDSKGRGWKAHQTAGLFLPADHIKNNGIAGLPSSASSWQAESIGLGPGPLLPGLLFLNLETAGRRWFACATDSNERNAIGGNIERHPLANTVPPK